MIEQDASALAPRVQEQSKHKQGEGVRAGFVLALIASLVACLLAASYLVRTPFVLGPLVQQELTRLAERHDVNLQINTFRPVGLTGLRLEQVQVVAHHGSYLLAADLDAVNITPSLSELIGNRRVHPSSVEVDGGRIHISRAPRAETDKPESKNEESSAPSAPHQDAPTSRPASSKQARTPPAVRETRAILHDVSVSVRPYPLPGTTRPLVLDRAELVLSTAGAVPFDFRHGYGVLPDATPFGVRQVRGDGPDTYVIEPEVATRIDKWFAAPIPAGLSVTKMTVCPECEPARVVLSGLRATSPTGLVAQAQTLELEASTTQVRLGLSEVSFDGADNAPPYRLRDLETSYDAHSKTAVIQGEVFDANQGHAAFASNWSGQWGTLETRIELDRFDTGALWGPLGMSKHVEGGVHTGHIETTYEPWMDLIEFAMDIDTRQLTFDLPLVTGDPLAFEQVGLRLDASFQPRARAFSVSTGEADLGRAAPIRFGGYAVDAGRGWVFETYATADNLHPQRLRDGLPPTIARLARGTEFDGEFGFDVRSAGHTAYPESISLTVDFRGDVEVSGDSSYADVLALAADGPPSIDLPGTLATNVPTNTWIAYDSLPDYVPQVLTAAEDAKFFSHDGFDWRGLRRALVHNIKEGGIERGGSTLSQQLSKNLFLDHERTLARKLQEAYVTWRLESELSKKRILELYMNMVEFGPNVRGLRHAARRYFDIEPEELSVEQVALLASVLPGPSLFGQQVLSGYLPSSRVEKIEHILSNLRFLRVIGRRAYRKMYERAKEGSIGGLELTVCDDDGKAAEGTPKCP